MNSKRLERLITNLRKNDRIPYLISDLINIRYLTGFRGSYAYLLIDEDKTFFFSDSRYEEYAKSILPQGMEFILQEKDIVHTLKKFSSWKKYKKIYLEEHSLNLSGFLLLKNALTRLKIVPGGDEVNSIRIIKEKEEIELIKKAVKIADECYSHILKLVKPGMMEWDLAIEIECYYKKHGCTKTSFDSIIASGKGSSMPHHVTSMTKRIEKGDILLIDMGCVYEGYNSDLTRTLFINSVDPEFEKIYQIVKNAQEASIKAVRSGISAGSLDKVARDYIAKAGYKKEFGHSLGHGVGLEVHEYPAIKSGGRFRIKENMIFTIEPGIYIPNSGGIRIEDMVLVTGDGVEVLTESSKEIIII
jgi:Xaa-Pro aminopeptidase